MSLADAREKLEGPPRSQLCKHRLPGNGRYHNNRDRRHGAIGYNVPLSIHRSDGVTSPSSWRSRKNPASGGPRLGRRAEPCFLAREGS